MKKCFLTLSLITILSLAALAQNATVSAVVNSSVNSVATGALTLGAFTTDAEIESGLVTEPMTFAVKSNRLWKFTTQITNIVGTPLPSETITAPLLPGNISWGVANGAAVAVNSWTLFSQASPTTTAIVVAKQGSRGAPAVSGNTFTVRYKVIPTFAVDPGTYAIDVTHTVSAQ